MSGEWLASPNREVVIGGRKFLYDGDKLRPIATDEPTTARQETIQHELFGLVEDDDRAETFAASIDSPLDAADDDFQDESTQYHEVDGKKSALRRRAGKLAIIGLITPGAFGLAYGATTNAISSDADLTSPVDVWQSVEMKWQQSVDLIEFMQGKGAPEVSDE